MQVVRIQGHVLPTELELTLPTMLSASCPWPERNLTPKFTISIRKSEIDVECTVERYSDTDCLPLHARALNLCQAAVSLCGFLKGVGPIVVLDRFINPNGKQRSVTLYDQALPHLCTSIRSDEDLIRLFELLGAEPTLARLLNDLTTSISMPEAAILNCGRVVDGIRNLIAASELNDEGAWEEMRCQLNLDRTYLQLITDLSRGPRHGRATLVRGLARVEVIRRSWNVMNRYLEYRKRGCAQLPPDGFPLLKE